MFLNNRKFNNLLSKKNYSSAMVVKKHVPSIKFRSQQTKLNHKNTQKTIQPSIVNKAQSTPTQTQPRPISIPTTPGNKNNIPHQYVSQDIQVDKLAGFVSLLKMSQIEITREDILMKCVALALKEVSEFNVQWSDADYQSYPRSTISVCVINQDGTNYEIESPDAKGLQAISDERKTINLEKKQNSCDSSICIYDFGLQGVRSFVPIVKSPQVAVISLGGETKKLIMDPTLRTQTTSSLSLSFDGRSIDFETASKFFKKVVTLFENPDELFL